MAERFRNEQKYLLKKSDSNLLKMSIDSIMDKDEHVGEGKSYLIRSIYFDDMFDSCLQDKINGVDDREKWRIRTYNCDSSVIHLECKRKVRGMTWKDSISITPDDAFDAIRGNVKTSKDRPPLWNKFAINVITQGYRPVTIVQYERIPYIWKPSNVRVTFDMNLASSEMFDRFYDTKLPVRPILPDDLELIEVKFDELLPDHIRHALNIRNMRFTSFSKYELCRRMPMNPAFGMEEINEL